MGTSSGTGSLPRRVLRWATAIVVLLVVLWSFRLSLLRALGDHLIDPDPLVSADAVYVLGGAPVERGIAAARLLRNGQVPKAYCVGGVVHPVLEAEGIRLTDAALGRRVMVRAGADSTRVGELPVGTSTWEEAGAILDHAVAQGFDTVMVVSTEFHVRRVKRVFRKRLEGRPITVVVRPAASLRYDSAQWWRSEEGLLMVNNEYVKTIYYWLNY